MELGLSSEEMSPSKEPPADLPPSHEAGVESLRAQAEAAFAGGLLDDADGIWILALDQDDSFWPAHLGRGRVAHRKGDLSSAIESFRRSVRIAPSEFAPSLELAQALREAGKFDEAWEALTAAGEIRPDHWAVPLNLGLICRARKDDAEAIQLFQRSVDLGGGVSAAFHLGQSLLDAGNDADAEAAFLAAVSKDGRHLGSLLGLGLALKRLGRPLEALERFREAVRADPMSAQAEFEVAQVLREVGEYSEARVHYRKALVVRPSFAAAYFGLGLTAASQERWTDAASYFRRAERLNPTLYGGKLEAAKAYRNAGRTSEALNTLSTRLKLEPRNEAVAKLFSEIVAAIPDEEECFSVLRRLARRYRLPPDLEVRLAQMEGDRGDLAGALRRLTRLQQSGGETCRAALMQYRLMKRLGRQKDASGRLSRALTLWPSDAGLLLAKADSLREMGDVDGAALLYQSKSLQAREPYSALIGLGLIASARGDRDWALRHFREATQAAPDKVSARLEEAAVLSAMGRRNEAWAILQRLLEFYPVDPAVAGAAARMSRDVLAREQQVELYKKYIALSPQNAQALVELAKIYELDGDIALMQDALAQAEAVNPKELGLLEARAHLAEIVDDFPLALSFTRKARAIAPTNSVIIEREARLEARLGRTQRAIGLLEGTLRRNVKQPRLWLALATRQSEVGDLQAAAKTCEKALVACPGSSDLVREAVLIALKRKGPDEAMSLLEAFSAGAPLPEREAAFVMGECYLSRREPALALTAFDRAYDLGCDAPEVLERVALAAVLAHEHERARTALETMTRHIRGSLVLKRRSLNVSQSFLGQLLDEFSIDRDVASRLKSASQGQAATRHHEIASIVRSSPGNTPTCLALVDDFASRRNNLSSAVEASKCIIPNNIMSYREEGVLGEDIASLDETWRCYNSNFDFEEFTPALAMEFIRGLGRDDLTNAFIRAKSVEAQERLAALVWLHERGGVYREVNTRAIGPVASLFRRGASLVLLQDELGAVGGGIIAAAPKNPVITIALTSLVEALNNGDRDIPWLMAGPGLITRSLAAFLCDSGAESQIHQQVVVLDETDASSSIVCGCIVSSMFKVRVN